MYMLKLQTLSFFYYVLGILRIIYIMSTEVERFIYEKHQKHFQNVIFWFLKILIELMDPKTV